MKSSKPIDRANQQGVFRRFLAGLLVGMPMVLSGQASAQVLDLPTPGEVIGSEIQSVISLSGTDAAVSGRFRTRDASSPDQQSVNILRFVHVADMSRPASGWWSQSDQQWVFGVSRYRDDDTVMVALDDSAQPNTAPITLQQTHWLLSAGAQSVRPLGDGLYVKYGAMAHWGSAQLKASFDALPAASAQVMRALFDHKYVNTQIQTLSVSSELAVGWRMPLAGAELPPLGGSTRPAVGPTVVMQLTAAPLLTRAVKVEDASQRFSHSSLSWHGQFGVEWLTDERWLNRPVALTAAYQRHQFPSSAQVMSSSYINELSLGALLVDRQHYQGLDGYGVKLAYMQGQVTRGWRVQLEWVF